MVAAVGRPEDSISDVAANQLGDGFDHTFFGANDRLIDDIQWSASSCASACDVMNGRTVLPVDDVSLSALFFAFLIT